MDSDEEDSAEEDDEGGSPVATDNGIFDDDAPGLEGRQGKIKMLENILGDVTFSTMTFRITTISNICEKII
jgi:hypothetical protein